MRSLWANISVGVETGTEKSLEIHRQDVSPRVWMHDTKESLLRQIHIDVYYYFCQHLIPERDSVKLINANDPNLIFEESYRDVRSIVNLTRVNDFTSINNFFVKINNCLPDAGMFIGCVETACIRKQKHFNSNWKLFKHFLWFHNFMFHRVHSKSRYTKDLYLRFTKHKYRWLTKAEVLGRLVCCGFEVIEYREINGLLYFVVMKTRKPSYYIKNSFGPLFAMTRIGKGGKAINVFKVRTMHPYSEYLQDFVIRLNGYNEVGKPANDFRLTRWGKFFRKYWIDEIPQFINVLKGDMALVGVRPLSRSRFKELPLDVQKERVKYKPGCIPPYVALLMPDAKGNIEAERIYMKEKQKYPVWTDVKYFFLGVFNIVTGKIRSS